MECLTRYSIRKSTEIEEFGAIGMGVEGLAASGTVEPYNSAGKKPTLKWRGSIFSRHGALTVKIPEKCTVLLRYENH